MRSTWAAVPARPTASSRASVAGVATRVRARTLAQESSPRARAPARPGSVPRARATRTRSRAAPRSSPTRQASQAAQDRKPVFHPPRASKARMRSRRRPVAASRCAESSAISSPRRSSSAARCDVGCKAVKPSGSCVGMASPPFSWDDSNPTFRERLEPPRPRERAAGHHRSSLEGRPRTTRQMRDGGSAFSRPARHTTRITENSVKRNFRSLRGCARAAVTIPCPQTGETR